MPVKELVPPGHLWCTKYRAYVLMLWMLFFLGICSPAPYVAFVRLLITACGGMGIGGKAQIGSLSGYGGWWSAPATIRSPVATCIVWSLHASIVEMEIWWNSITRMYILAMSQAWPYQFFSWLTAVPSSLGVMGNPLHRVQYSDLLAGL